MVQSTLVKSINYKEIKDIDEENREYFKEFYKLNDAITYNIKLFDQQIEITFGLKNNSFLDKNIVYYPIYLVVNDIMSYQIGILELFSNDLFNNLDENGDIIFDNLNNTLFFSYSKEFIEKIIKAKAIKTIKKSKPKPPASNKKDDNLDDEIDKLLEESEEPDITIHDTSSDKKKHTDWIQKFMKDNHYTIKHTDPNGNCFFEAASIAMQSIKKNVSIDELRSLLSSKVNDEIFNTYKLLYENAIDELKKLTLELSALETTKKELNIQFKKTKNRTDQKVIESKYYNIKDNIKDNESLKLYQLNLLEDFKFMKDITTIEQLKGFILSRSYWADTWAITTIERILNVKFIILSEEAYTNKDFGNILQCGQLNDELSNFEPSHYIIVSYTGNHYNLIEYKEIGALKFTELTINIKDLIKDKCLERNAGPWYIIPEFKEYKDHGLEEIEPELYDDDIVFQFYAKSDAKPYPGKGSGEKIPKDRIKDFAELSRITNWRKKLSNFWDGHTFDLDGKKWKSVEHYYQGSKFKKNNFDFYKEFSLDSKSKLSEDTAFAKAAGDKTGKYKDQQIRDKKITIDPDFDKRKKEEILNAQIAKFQQNDDLKDLLIKTKNAKLQHYSRGTPAIVFKDLMLLRKRLS